MEQQERKSRRSARLGELIREEVSRMISRGEVKDPRIGFVTITAARMSEDLQLCRLYVSALGTDEQKELTIRGLDRASGYVRSVLAKRLRIKRMPQIVFVRDDSLERAQRVDELLDSLQSELERADAGDEGDADDGLDLG